MENQELRDRGFVLVQRVIEDPDLEELRREADAQVAADRNRGGARNLLQRSPRFRELAANGAVIELARKLLGKEARPTKLTLFDKTSAANWKIHWHQGVTVAVRRRLDVEGFDGWSEKEGVVHAQAPAEVLESMVALRLHLDETPMQNGALRVIVRSHCSGRLSRAEIRRRVESGEEVFCEVGAGGVIAMRPLLLHASSACAEPAHRRVLHFENSSTSLPGGLEWLDGEPTPEVG